MTNEHKALNLFYVEASRTAPRVFVCVCDSKTPSLIGCVDVFMDNDGG